MFDSSSHKLLRLFLAAPWRYTAARPRPGNRAARGARLTVEALEERALLAAAGAGFVQSNLVSDMPGLAAFTDPQLLNPWGLTASAQGPFWVADNQTGFSTLYDGAGNKNGLVVNIPSAPGNPFTHPTPTGTVFNTDPNPADFNVTAMGQPMASVFLFATLDGTVSGWNGLGTDAVLAVQSPGSIFTGLAIDTSQVAGNTLLYAADWGKGTIDVFKGNFQQIDRGAFQDPAIPSGFRPFNVQDINGTIFVTYAQFAPATGADTGTGGFVAEFTRDGVLKATLNGNGPFNSPWGVAQAPAGFGNLGGDLLVGNFGDGHINAFDANGNFVGVLRDASGSPITIGNLWALRFGNGAGAGDANTLFFTAGVTDAPTTLFGASDGLLGALQPLTQNQRFVGQVYQDLLRRSVDATGLTAWTSLLNQGMSRDQVVQDIESSLEFRTDQVTAIYNQFLHRGVDPSGLATFTNLLASGGTVEQVEALVVGSAEYFQNRGGGTNTGFLSALYQDGLNRAVDPIGQAVFGMALANGVTPGQVAAAVFGSLEFLQDTVQGFYQNLLHRAADPTGLNAFVSALQSGATDQQVIAAIAGSSEFFANV
jgi:uncharacterized protein (TIGR03118 family)